MARRRAFFATPVVLALLLGACQTGRYESRLADKLCVKYRGQLRCGGPTIGVPYTPTANLVTPNPWDIIPPGSYNPRTGQVQTDYSHQYTAPPRR